MPTPPGNRFAAHAPVVRIHLVDDDDRGSRIFPQDAHKQFRRPLDEFRFLLGGRRAVFPRHPDIDVIVDTLSYFFISQSVPIKSVSACRLMPAGG